MKKNKKIILLTAIMSLSLFMTGVFALLPKTAYAADCGSLKDRDLRKCQESIQECTDGNDNGDTSCRKAFRAGFDESISKKGEGKDSFCKQSKKRDKEACLAGINAGNSDYKNNPSGTGNAGPKSFPGDKGTYQCGNLSEDSKNVKTKIKFGCLGDTGPQGMGPIEDLFYALIRFLTNGVGIAMVVALIAAGIMYTTSEGNAEQTIKAKRRIQNIMIALFIYLFIYAIIQFLVPGGVFK